MGRETICWALHAQDLQAVTKDAKPLFTKEISKERLTFAKSHKHWTVEDWKRVLWSDESRMNRLGSNGKQWAWKKPAEGLTACLTKPTAQAGGGFFMVWGCFGWDGVGYLTKLSVNMTKEVYVEVLEYELMNTLEYYGLEVDDIIFQHDNAPSHKAGLTQNWLNDHGFEVLEWPRYSPDLSPIENLWSQVKQDLGDYDEPASGMLELWEWVQEKWEAIPAKKCQELIESMPRRMAAVIKAKGQATKY